MSRSFSRAERDLAKGALCSLSARIWPKLPKLLGLPPRTLRLVGPGPPFLDLDPTTLRQAPLGLEDLWVGDLWPFSWINVI